MWKKITDGHIDSYYDKYAFKYSEPFVFHPGIIILNGAYVTISPNHKSVTVLCPKSSVENQECSLFSRLLFRVKWMSLKSTFCVLILFAMCIQPDVAAPGVAVLAAIVPRPDRPGGIPAGEKPATYDLRSGTSMACPHVTGAAAFIKSVRRKWTYSMIKSALMTTGTPIFQTPRFSPDRSVNSSKSPLLSHGITFFSSSS